MPLLLRLAFEVATPTKPCIVIISDIVTCKVLCAWLIRRVVDSMIRFIDTLYIQLGTTGNYIIITDLHNLQFTVTHAMVFSVFTSRILATDFITVSVTFEWHIKSSFRGPIPFFLFFCTCQFRTYLLTYSLTELSPLRSRQLCTHSRTSQHFMKHEGSIPCSQEPSSGTYPEPDPSSPHHPILSLSLSKIHFNIVHASTWVSPANLHSTKFSPSSQSPGQVQETRSGRRAEWAQFGLTLWELKKLKWTANQLDKRPCSI
jgi:hypothetical protein